MTVGTRCGPVYSERIGIVENAKIRRSRVVAAAATILDVPQMHHAQIRGSASMAASKLGKSSICAAPYGVSPMMAEFSGAFEVESQGGGSKSTVTRARPLRTSLSKILATSSGSMRAVTGFSRTKSGVFAALTLAHESPKALAFT